MAKTPKRFEIIHTETSQLVNTTSILRDKETGVCYLVHSDGTGTGITPLLNAVGGHVITGLPELR